MKKQILFVDDDPNLLAGLKRALRKEREEWDMQFAESAAQALALADFTRFDLVVSDMQMPNMNGAQLFDTLAQKYPNTIRIILSGYSDESLVVQAVRNTHQFLAKPTDAQTIAAVIRRALALRSLVGNEALERLTTRIGSLPPLPKHYKELRQMLQSTNSSIRDIGQLIGADPALAIKILQLVNSAFFGLGHYISSPEQAAALLGVDTIGALVLSVELFSGKTPEAFAQAGITLADLHERSLRVAKLARKIASDHGDTGRFADECYLAALLHDIGRLILVQAYPNEYRLLCAAKLLSNAEILSAEHQLFGSDHAGVAAYLLGLWGFGDDILEAVAYHHNPADSGNEGFKPLTVVHVAASLLNPHANCAATARVELDMPYIRQQGLTERLGSWQQFADEIMEGGSS